MTAVVIPVRPGEDNQELRFALRSIAAHVSDPDVTIVGYRPRWLHGVRWIPNYPTGVMKSDRGCQQVRAAVEHPQIPEAFWWWDDDMFRLAPLPDEVGHLHGGPVADWVARFTDHESQYARALRRTAALQVDDPATARFYDLHVPFWVHTVALRDTMSLLPDRTGGWLWRTVHGNRHRYGGRPTRDVKLYFDDPIPSLGPWLSCDTVAWRRLQPVLAERFPTPSPWEGPADQTWTVVGTYRRDDTVRELPYRAPTDQALQLAGWQRVSLTPHDQAAPA